MAELIWTGSQFKLEAHIIKIGPAYEVLFGDRCANIDPIGSLPPVHYNNVHYLQRALICKARNSKLWTLIRPVWFVGLAYTHANIGEALPIYLLGTNPVIAILPPRLVRQWILEFATTPNDGDYYVSRNQRGGNRWCRYKFWVYKIGGHFSKIDVDSDVGVILLKEKNWKGQTGGNSQIILIGPRILVRSRIRSCNQGKPWPF